MIVFDKSFFKLRELSLFIFCSLIAGEFQEAINFLISLQPNANKNDYKFHLKLRVIPDCDNEFVGNVARLFESEFELFIL